MVPATAGGVRGRSSWPRRSMPGRSRSADPNRWIDLWALAARGHRPSRPTMTNASRKSATRYSGRVGLRLVPHSPGRSPPGGRLRSPVRPIYSGRSEDRSVHARSGRVQGDHRRLVRVCGSRGTVIPASRGGSYLAKNSHEADTLRSRTLRAWKTRRKKSGYGGCGDCRTNGRAGCSRRGRPRKFNTDWDHLPTLEASDSRLRIWNPRRTVTDGSIELHRFERFGNVVPADIEDDESRDQ